MPYIYLSSRYHLKVSHDVFLTPSTDAYCHKQMILTLRCLKVHRSTCAQSYVEQRFFVRPRFAGGVFRKFKV